jgi:intracellular sulfur oxidation DsrE/DsrF family protein
MTSKKLLLTFLAAIGLTLVNHAVADPLSGTTLTPPASSPAKLHRVIFDVSVNEAESYKTLLRNIANLKKTFGPENVEIEVVAYSKGLDLFVSKDPELVKGVNSLATEGGVELAACSNTVKARNLAVSDLPEKTKVIDSGVAELVRRQEEGWSYIQLASYQAQP